MFLAQRIREVLALEPASAAIIVEGDSYPWSYISTFVDGLGRVLGSMSRTSGLSVGLITRNRPPHLAAVAACVANEYCLVTLSPMYSDTALASDISSLGLHILIGDRSDLARPEIMNAALSSGVAIVEIGDDHETPFRVLRELQPSINARVRAGIAIEMLSSGTTGIPKRISLTYENLEASMGPAGPRSAKGTSEVAMLQARPALVWHPMVHVSGAVFVIEAIYSGRSTILMERFDAEKWVAFVERYEVRVAHLNPTTMRMILEANIEPSRLQSLRVLRGGTTATTPELQVEFEERFAIPLLTTYGATEFSGAVASWSPADHRLFGRSKVGSSGRAHPGVELRTIDPNSDVVLAPGEEGILEVRAPQSAGGRENWARTTDLAVIDDDGFLWIKGRADDAIIRGGFKVHPAKIVKLLEAHPSVYEAAVIGIPDERLGAVPVGAVTLRAGTDVPSTEVLFEFLRSGLATYEVPRAILIVDELPKTPSLKVNRLALRALFDATDATK